MSAFDAAKEKLKEAIDAVSSSEAKPVAQWAATSEWNFIPWGDHIAIQINEVTKTAGGLILPDQSEEGSYESPTATVLACGPEVKHVKIGDVIMIQGRAGMAIGKMKGVDFHITTEKAVIGTIVGITGWEKQKTKPPQLDLEIAQPAPASRNERRVAAKRR